MSQIISKRRTLFLVVVVLVAGAAEPAGAQPFDNVRIGIVHGTVFFLNDVDPPNAFQGDEVEEATLSNAWGAGLEVGADVTSQLDVEAYVLVAPGADLKLELAGAPLSVNLDTRAIYAGGNFLYYFSPDGLRPFVEAGIGTRSRDLFKVYGGTNLYELAGNFGAGLAGKLTESVELRTTLHNHISSYARLTDLEGAEPSGQVDLWFSTSVQIYP